MTPTPSQFAVWAGEVQRQCLLEAGTDIDAGLLAMEYILSTQPIPGKYLSLKEGDRPEKETDTSLLYGQSEGAGSSSSAALDTAREGPRRAVTKVGRKPNNHIKVKGRNNKPSPKKTRARKKWA